MVAAALAAPTAASAWPISTDVELATSVLPIGHPCRAGVDVEWVPGLRVRGDRATGAAEQGVLVAGHWYAKSGRELMPLTCEVTLDPTEWDLMPACDRRRVVLHEIGHLAGHRHSEGGLMGPHADRVAVPGCPAVRETLVDRATDRVLGVVPAGWEVACGLARRGVVGCSASGRRLARRYRVVRRGAHLEVARARR